MKNGWILALTELLAAGSALALGPHEVLVLVNEASSNSVAIAGEFVRIRNVPEINVVRLNLPAYAGGANLDVSPATFTADIWTPALKAIRDRGIGDHILAWVYSVDFPTTIGTTPKLSIQGITFLRNVPVASEKVERGTYASSLFAGPNPVTQKAEMYASQTFDVSAETFRDDMPLPSMMLGYTGEHGNSRETVVKCLNSGVASDGTRPTGTVFFVTSDDVRSRCRQWQFESIRRELRPLGVRAEVTGVFPTGRQGIIGLMMGAEKASPGKGNRYLPGSMAEHLTSRAGEFQNASQTKLSAWIEAGAVASAGTVVEPMSAWPKFPSARFFVHYANGCTVMESFFQSLRCPLQILLIGEPLARPWAPTNAVLEVGGLGEGAARGVLQLRAEVKAPPGSGYHRFLYLLDGRTAGRERELRLDTATLAEGPHTVRTVAYSTDLVRSQVFVEKTITVVSGQRSAGPP